MLVSRKSSCVHRRCTYLIVQFGSSRTQISVWISIIIKGPDTDFLNYSRILFFLMMPLVTKFSNYFPNKKKKTVCVVCITFWNLWAVVVQCFFILVCVLYVAFDCLFLIWKVRPLQLLPIHWLDVEFDWQFPRSPKEQLDQSKYSNGQKKLRYSLLLYLNCNMCSLYQRYFKPSCSLHY